MADKQATPPPRSSLALSFDVMTLALFIIVLGITTLSVVEIGPAQALDRVGCGLTASGLLVYPRSCR